MEAFMENSEVLIELLGQTLQGRVKIENISLCKTNISDSLNTVKCRQNKVKEEVYETKPAQLRLSRVF